MLKTCVNEAFTDIHANLKTKWKIAGVKKNLNNRVVVILKSIITFKAFKYKKDKIDMVMKSKSI